MKAMKKLLAMFMALSLVFALAACGDNTQTPSQAGAESAAPAGSEEPAASEPAASEAGTETGDYGEFTTVEEAHRAGGLPRHPAGGRQAHSAGGGEGIADEGRNWQQLRNWNHAALLLWGRRRFLLTAR